MKTILEHLHRWALPEALPVEPAKGHQIDDLEEAAGGALLGAHRAFLEAMGANTGPLRVGLADTNIRELIDAYELIPWRPERPLVWLALDADPLAPAHYVLDYGRQRGTDDCAVLRVTLDGDGDGIDAGPEVVFASLRELLMYWLIRGVCLPRYEFQSLLVAKQSPDVEVVERSVEALLPTVLPHLEVNLGFEGPDGCALIDRRLTDQAVRAVRLGSTDERSHWARVALLDELGLQPAPAHPDVRG